MAQAIGRVGNYFNQELFGGPTTLPWALEIDPAHRPTAYARYTTFHPTFLYELIFDLTLAGVLIVLGRRQSVRPPGLFALYVAGYSGFRIFEELLRVDPSRRILGLRLNLYVASVLMIAGLAWFLRIQRADKMRRGSASVRRGGALMLAGAALVLAGCGRGAGTSASSPGRPIHAGRSAQPRVLIATHFPPVPSRTAAITTHQHPAGRFTS